MKNGAVSKTEAGELLLIVAELLLNQIHSQ
jgi:hypothetical protein